MVLFYENSKKFNSIITSLFIAFSINYIFVSTGVSGSSKSSSHSASTTSFIHEKIVEKKHTIFAPRPAEVKKHKKEDGERTTDKYRRLFIGTHGGDARGVSKGSGLGVSARIGHIQGYENHGFAADNIENLGVISKYANELMKRADGLYQDGDIDANAFIVPISGSKPGTQVVYIVQQLVTKDDKVLTPALVIPARLTKRAYIDALKKYKNKINRSFSRERIEEQLKTYRADPSKLESLETYREQVLRRIEKGDIKRAKLIKGPDQSRAKRKKGP